MECCKISGLCGDAIPKFARLLSALCCCPGISGWKKQTKGNYSRYIHVCRYFDMGLILYGSITLYMIFGACNVFLAKVFLNLYWVSLNSCDWVRQLQPEGEAHCTHHPGHFLQGLFVRVCSGFWNSQLLISSFFIPSFLLTLTTFKRINYLKI